MTWEYIFNVIVGLVLTLGGWLWKNVVSDIKLLDQKITKTNDKHEEFTVKVLTEYIPKADLQRFEDKVTSSINNLGTDLKKDLTAISMKLDTKQDKHN